MSRHFLKVVDEECKSVRNTFILWHEHVSVRWVVRLVSSANRGNICVVTPSTNSEE